LGPGVVPVRIEVLRDISPDIDSQKFSIQVGAFSVDANAESLKKHLQQKYKDVYITQVKTSLRTYFRVRIKASTKKNAEEIARKLQKDGFTVFILEQY